MLANRNVPNGSETVLGVIGELPAGTPVAFEAAFGWGWLVELLEDYGFAPHLAHPLQCKAIASARLKNDKVDAAILAQLLRADLLPEAWIAPVEVRALRALLRHRASLVRLRTIARNRIHAVLAEHGHHRVAGIASGTGLEWLQALALPTVGRQIVDDELAVIDALAPLIAGLDEQVVLRAKKGPRVKVLTALPGVGTLTALTISGRDWRHHPVPLRAASRILGRAHTDGAQLRPDRTARAHQQAGLSLVALDPLRGSANGQAQSHVQGQLRRARSSAGEEDRDHRDRAQAAHPLLSLARRTRPPRPHARWVVP